jgi:hypothetical protein
VIEANPVWSSNPYSADLKEVVGAIQMAFSRPVSAWIPDAALMRYAMNRPLVVSRPTWLGKGDELKVVKVGR